MRRSRSRRLHLPPLSRQRGSRLRERGAEPRQRRSGALRKPRQGRFRAAGAGHATCRGVAPAAIRPRVAPGVCSGKAGRAARRRKRAYSPRAAAGWRSSEPRRAPGARATGPRLSPIGAPGTERVLPELGESCAGRGFAPVLRGVPRTALLVAVCATSPPQSSGRGSCRRQAAMLAKPATA